MVILSCKRLRRVVLLAGVFLIVGMFLEVIAHLFASPLNLAFIQPLALCMVLASPVIILLTVVISLIPGLTIKDCVH
jgi:hypothetical protein